MSFLSGITGGLTGFLSGGPVGAAVGLLGGLFGGKKSSGAAQAPVANVVDLSDPAQEAHDKALIAFMEGYLGGGQQNQKTTGFDPVAALVRGQEQRSGVMQQTANQRGGQASPGLPGQGIYNEKLGSGKGGGTVNPFTRTEQDFWRGLVGQTIGGTANRYSSALQQPFTSYMQSALAGNAGLPVAAMQQATLQGERTINAQAAQARQSLQDNLGSRGLASSGLMARGLRGVEQTRGQSIGDLISGLAQQNMQARVEAQRAAAGMFPGLMQAESGSSNDLVRSWLALRQLELEAGRLGLAKQQAQSANDQALWGGIGSLIGGLFGGGGSSGGSSDWHTPLVFK